MKKSIFRIILRKMRKNIRPWIGMAVLVMIGAGFFVTVYTVLLKYNQSVNALYNDCRIADVTFYGTFDDADEDTLSSLLGDEAGAVAGRRQADIRDGEVVLRALTMTEGVNELHIYEGELPKTAGECAMIKKPAVAQGYSVGDTVSFGDMSFTLTAIVDSPEYVFLIQDRIRHLADARPFSVIFVTSDAIKGPYAEIAIKLAYPDEYDDEEFEALSASIGAERWIKKTGQTGYRSFIGDIQQIKTFAYIFPGVFAALIAIVVYVLLRRMAERERRQIGVYKALGVDEDAIAFIYIAQAVVASFVGSVVGCVMTTWITGIVYGLLSVLFSAPGLNFAIYPALWYVAIVVSLFIGIAAALLAVWNLHRLSPASAMRRKQPPAAKRTLFERIGFLWKRLSFNTRYMLKSMMRGINRFAAVVLGIMGACALMVFSLGFYDSMIYSQYIFFEDFLQYDVMISLPLAPLSSPHECTEYLDDYDLVLIVPFSHENVEYLMYIVQDGFDKVSINADILDEGVIIPRSYADRWGVKAGDTLSVAGMEVRIAELSNQSFGLAVYASYYYLYDIVDELAPVYNLILGVADDLGPAEEYMLGHNINFSTRSDDRQTFDAIMNSIFVLVWLMLACALILGVVIVFSVEQINLQARQYEYMFMGVMGYSRANIMLAHIKETLVQLCLAIPLGILLGGAMLQLIKKNFSNNFFVLHAHIETSTIVLCAAAIIVLAGLLAVYTSRTVDRMDIVQGLKETDE